jgi:hypothetical protein
MPVSNLNKYLTEGAIEGFASLIAPITALSYVVKGTSALNDVVRVPYATNNSASGDFSYGTGYSADYNEVVGKSVTMDKLKFQPIKLTDSDLATLNPEALKAVGNAAGARLAADVISASLAAVVTQANFPNSGSFGASSFTASLGLANLNKVANDYGWLPTDRTLICNTTAWFNLMQNSAVIQASSFGSSDPVQQGKLSTVIGFNPYVVNIALPNSDQAIALSRNGILFAQGYHAAQDSGQAYTALEQITDTKSNLTIGFRQYYDAAKATNYRVFDCLFGVGVGAANALYHFK